MHTGKSDTKEESERVVRAAAQLIKKNYKKVWTWNWIISNSWLHNFSRERICTRASKGVYKGILELIISPIRLTTNTQTLFLVQPNLTVTRLNFGLAVSVDNCLHSKWMINLLHKLAFSARSNEVSDFTSKSVPKGNLAKIRLWIRLLIWTYNVFLK